MSTSIKRQRTIPCNSTVCLGFALIYAVPVFGLVQSSVIVYVLVDLSDCVLTKCFALTPSGYTHAATALSWHPAVAIAAVRLDVDDLLTLEIGRASCRERV